MLIQDLRYLVRSLIRQPGFTLVTLLILVLCIGGNTVIFSAVNAVSLRPLPYPNAERLAIVEETYPPGGDGTYSPSYPTIVDWRRGTATLDRIVAFLDWQYRIMPGDGQAERVKANYIEHDYFEVLGTTPVLGRAFLPQEDRELARVAILSHGLWHRRFGGNPQILGKQVALNRGSYTVVGVMPADFVDIPEPHYSHAVEHPTDLWLPLQATTDVYGEDFLTDRTQRMFTGALVRLKPDHTWAQARSDLGAIAEQISKDHPDSNQDYGVSIDPLTHFILGNLDQSLLILLAGSLLVLLIGCVNVGNLLLIRTWSRSQEMRIRIALGAGRSQLLRRLILESMVLALAGAIGGLIFAVWAVRLLATGLELPRIFALDINLGVFLAALVATLVTAALVALPSAWRIWRRGAGESLQLGSRGEGGSTARPGRGLKPLVVVEMAVAVVLLAGAGLLVRSFFDLRIENVNYDATNLLAMRLEMRADAFSGPDVIAGVDRDLLAAVAGVTGVEGAALWAPGIPGINGTFIDIFAEGSDPVQGRVQSDLHCASPGAFGVLRIPLTSGREFTLDDTRSAPRVAVINELLAEKLWPGKDPLGRRFANRPEGPFFTVVGTYPAERLTYRLGGNTNPTLIVPILQSPRPDQALLARTEGRPEAVIPSLRQAVAKVHPDIPVFDTATVEQRLRREEAESRFNAILMGLYAALALILSVLGIYGVLAYSVAHRQQEIGLRVALGAERKTVLGMLFKEALVFCGLGLGIGLVAALALARFLTSILRGVKASDPLTFVTVAAVFLAASLAASYFPARRALDVDPVLALRSE